MFTIDLFEVFLALEIRSLTEPTSVQYVECDGLKMVVVAIVVLVHQMIQKSLSYTLQQNTNL